MFSDLFQRGFTQIFKNLSADLFGKIFSRTLQRVIRIESSGFKLFLHLSYKTFNKISLQIGRIKLQRFIIESSQPLCQ